LSFGGNGNFRGTRLGAAAYALLVRIVGELTAAAAAATEPKKRLLYRLFIGSSRASGIDDEGRLASRL
jgi:hypothetical protein